MRRSKLETYVDILSALAFKGPLKLTHIMYKSNVNCQVLKEQLEFLMKNGLVEKKMLRKEKVVYAITPRGIATLKAFGEIKRVFLIEEKEIRRAPLLY